jgi:transcriptional regulator with XRE-family HTH domain
MLQALGNELRESRKAAQASLEKVARSANISAPYLLKLERGLVNTPSPRVLARLASALDLSYFRLMELAGYLDEEQLAALTDRSPRPHPLADQTLTPDEWHEVGAFIGRIIAGRHEPEV